MKARLVQLEGGRRVQTALVEEVPLTIGRDAACGLVVESAQVSRTHARVEMLGGVHYLEDLHSANGTRHRGRAVEGRVALEPGDEFTLADEVVIRYEGVGDPWWPWVGASVAVAVGVALALFLLAGSDPVWDEAVSLAGEAVEADARRDYEASESRVRAAVGLLLREGRLDDVKRSETVEVAIARLEEALGGDVDLEAILARSAARSEPEALAETRECRLDAVGVDDFEFCLRDRIEHVMHGLRQDPTEVPERFYGEVARRLRIENAFLASALERGARYRDMMIEELQRTHMPPLLHYLACIESGYRTQARSPAGAAGLWQFMPGTARDYGLHVGRDRDDRIDPRRSTAAAAQYLRSLVFEFGGESLMLVLASYNRGENGVRRSLKRLDNPYADRSYWVLVERGFLPSETAEYVERFVAAAVAGEAGLPSEAVLRAAGY